MVLLTIEGFDHLETGNPVLSMQDLWKHSDAASGITLSTTVTPTGRGNSVLLNGGAYLRYYFENNHSAAITGLPIISGIVGFHFYHSDFSKAGANDKIIDIIGTGAVTNSQVSLEMTTEGAIELERGNVVIGRSVDVLQNNTWYHIEMQYYISDSIPANTFMVKVDGHPWITLAAGTDTQFYGNPSVEFIQWNGPANTPQYLDDIYFVSLTGSAPTSSLSSSFVQTLFPTGDGSQIDFIGSDGNQVNNFQQVDEASPDEDTTYNQITSDGRDRYNFSTLSGTITSVHGVGLTSRARSNQESPTRGWNNFAFVSGINYDQPSGLITGLNYAFFNSVLGRNPNTGGEWTDTSVNDAQFGVEYTT